MKCGAQIPDDSKFCIRCGTPVQAETGQKSISSGNQNESREIPEKAIQVQKQSGSKATGIIIALVAAILAVSSAFAVFYIKSNRKDQDTAAVSVSEKPDDSQKETISQTEETTAAAAQPSGETGFSTEKECIDYLAEQIAADNPEKALNAFCINHMAENSDFSNVIGYIGSWHGNLYIKYPSSSKIYLERNKEKIREAMIDQVANLSFSLYGNEEFLQCKTVTVDQKDADTIEKQMQMPDLSSFKCIGLTLLEYPPDTSDKEAAMVTIKRHVSHICSMYGCQDEKQYMAEYEWNGNRYSGGLTFAQYNGKWFIESLNSGLAGTVNEGFLTKE